MEKHSFLPRQFVVDATKEAIVYWRLGLSFGRLVFLLKNFCFAPRKTPESLFKSFIKHILNHADISSEY